MSNFVSLFSGCGGLDIGFLKSGFKCAGAFDIDSNAVDNYKKNLGEWITKLDLNNKINLPLNNYSQIDVVVSGSPCQGYSTIGKREYLDPRNNLLIRGGEIAIELNSKVFIAENVTGSTYGKHKIYWEELISRLKSSKYNVELQILNSEDFGLAQLRKRVFLFAWKGTKKVDFNFSRFEKKNLKDVLSNLSNNLQNNYCEIIDTNDPRSKICNSIKPGQKLCDVRGGDRSVHSWNIPTYFGQCDEDEISLLELIMVLRRKIRNRNYGDADPVHIDELNLHFKGDCQTLLNNLIRKGFVVEKSPCHYDLKRSFNGKYRRLSWHRPSLTVDTNFGNPNYFLHPDENRGLTAREAARIQGFDDDYIFYGNHKQQFKLIGNAVPPIISYVIAQFVKENLL